VVTLFAVTPPIISTAFDAAAAISLASIVDDTVPFETEELTNVKMIGGRMRFLKIYPRMNQD
jgi:hypothetical protein